MSRLPRKADPKFSVGLPRTKRVESLVIIYPSGDEELLEFPDDNYAFYRVEANITDDESHNENQFTHHRIWWTENKPT